MYFFIRIFGSGVIDRFRLGFEICIFLNFVIVILSRQVKIKSRPRQRTGTMKIEIAGQLGAYIVRNFVNPRPSCCEYGSFETGQ